jgi:hypothetical protein
MHVSKSAEVMQFRAMSNNIGAQSSTSCIGQLEVDFAGLVAEPLSLRLEANQAIRHRIEATPPPQPSPSLPPPRAAWEEHAKLQLDFDARTEDPPTPTQPPPPCLSLAGDGTPPAQVTPPHTEPPPPPPARVASDPLAQPRVTRRVG